MSDTIDSENKMKKISALIADLQDIKERFGDTCVIYDRISWGSNAMWQVEYRKKLHHNTEVEIEEIWREFWFEIIGQDVPLQVKKELADFYFVINEVPKVYDAITGSRLSKIMYPASVVVSEAEASIQRLQQHEREEWYEELVDEIEAEPNRSNDMMQLVGKLSERCSVQWRLKRQEQKA